jgi:hypothetical protein
MMTKSAAAAAARAAIVAHLQWPPLDQALAAEEEAGAPGE